MAKQPLITSVVTISAVDYSAQIYDAMVSPTVDENATECFGDTAHRREGGLTDGTFNCSFRFNTDLTNKNTISALLNTVVAVTYKSDNGAIAAGNPELQFNVLVTEVPPWGGAVGGIDDVSVSWPLDTAVTYDVTP